MITFFSDKSSKLPMYEQLYQFIKQDIESGKIKNKEKMPSKRMLATHLKVSVATIENAYSKLVSEGYLVSHEKSGYYVENAPFPKLNNGFQNNIEIIDDFYEEYYRYDFRTNAIDPELFPYSVWSKLARNVLQDHSHDLLTSRHPKGLKQLRNAIAVYLYRFRGITAQPEQIIISSGADTIYHQIIQILGKDVVYATENPGYQKINQLLEANDCTTRHIILDPSGISASDLNKSDASIVHVSPSHHYPTGIMMTIKRKIELLEWANKENNRYIIEDDYDSEFSGGSIPVPALQSLDHHEKVIYMNTFSKVIAPSLRIGYFVLPRHLLTKYQAMKAFNTCTVPNFEQFILTKFLSEGYFESHLNRLRSAYRKRKEELINQLVTQGVVSKNQIFNSDSGLHFVVQIDTTLSEKQLVDRAKENSIYLYGLHEFFYGNYPKIPAVIVFGYSSIRPEKIKPAVDALREAWNITIPPSL